MEPPSVVACGRPVNALASAVPAAGVIGGGGVIAVAGLLLSVRASRRRVTAGGPSTRSDPTVAVTVFGPVGVTFGAGDIAFLLLTTG